MTELEAYEQIAKLIAEAEGLILQAESIADKNNLAFRYEGPTYGMGGTYIGGEPKYRWQEHGWNASSGSC
jgi:hypothetical protein